jgi:hypothetical protein
MRFAVSGVYGNVLDSPVTAHDRDIIDKDLAAPTKLRRKRLSLVFGPGPPKKRNRVGQSMLCNFLARLSYRVALSRGRFRPLSASGADERGADRHQGCSAPQHAKSLPAKLYNPPPELGMNGTRSLWEGWPRPNRQRARFGHDLGQRRM